ncbi:MAG: polysaccharide pyruvyl transferase family protein [Bacteroidales bacterium]|nr:polysaccharide pyruvyl transferase family protein [Bacteroidales bacterium]
MKRVLILSQPLHNNYGGLLQAFALQKVIKSLGFDVATNRIILHDNKLTTRKIWSFGKSKIKSIVFKFLRKKDVWVENSKTISRYTSKFVDNYIQTENADTLSRKIAKKYDIFIVGSDQVFRKRWSQVTKYFLEDLKRRSDKTKIVYAASFGTDDLSEWTEDDIKICKKLAPKFRAVSVREDTGIGIMKDYFNIVAEHVLDPTLLLNKEDYLQVIDKEDEHRRNKIMMTYILDKTDGKTEIIELVKNKLGLEALEVMPKEKYCAETTDIENCVYPSVSKWISGFRDAEFVVTDSFHGTVFSIIFNKPFICISNGLRGITRITSLLKIFDLENRLITSKDNFSETLLCPINYDNVNSIWNQWKTKSMNFLRDSIC